MAHGFASILDECLAALRRGDDLESLLARYPEHAQELRPHLLLARRLGLTTRHEPRPGAQRAAWQQFHTQAEDMRLGRRPRLSMSISIGWMRPLAIAASLVLAILAAGGATVYASQDALPDSPLYRVKLATEDVRLWFVFDDGRKAEILLEQSNDRTDEIMEMVRSGKALPGNVLDALRERNARAVRILEDHPEELALLARAREQSAEQEDLLLALWGDLSGSARDDYAEAVATLHNARLRTAGAPDSVPPTGVCPENIEAEVINKGVCPEDVVAGVINITGAAEPVAEGLWLFGGVEVRLDSRTLGEAELEPGQTVRVIAAKGANGRLLALNVAVTDRQQPEQQYVVSGALDEVSDDEVVIGGQRIAITERTLLKLKPLLGQQVEIKVEDVDGQAVAASVKEGPTGGPAEEAPTLLVYEGVIEEEISTTEATDDWLVGGQRFLVTPDTELDAQAGALAKGARARVEAVAEDGEFMATRVLVLADEPEAEPEEEDAISVEGVFEAGNEERWTVSGVEVEAPAEAETPEAGSLVTLKGRREGDALVAGQVVASFAPERKGFVLLRGHIGRIDEAGSWQVGLASVQVSESTVVLGEPQEGSRVFIWASRDEKDSLQAVYVKVLDRRPPVAPGSASQD